jgi:hypothetical protein
VNGDGSPDLVCRSGSRVFWFVNSAIGFLEFEIAFEPDASLGVFAVGDFDGDNDQDIVIHRTSASGTTLSLYRFEGGAAFSESIALAHVDEAWPRMHAIDVVDTDGDNDLDVVASESVANGITNRISLYRNDAIESEGFSQVTLGSGRTILDVLSTGDVNSDGLPEVIASSSLETVWFRASGLVLQQGEIDSVAPSSYPVFSVLADDADGDGDDDVFLCDSRGLHFFRNRGGITPNFTEVPIAAGFGQVAVLGDVDLDGDNDLVADLDRDVHWYELLTARNETSGQRRFRIRAALQDAKPGDVIVADAGLFEPPCSPSTLDFYGKSVEVRSNTSLSLQASTLVIAASEASLVAESDVLSMGADLLIPDGAGFELEGAAVELNGSVSLGTHASLTLATVPAESTRSSPSVVIGGTPVFEQFTSNFDGRPVLVADLDDDSDPDIVTARPGAAQSGILVNQGDSPPTFSELVSTPIGDAKRSIDMNGDDIVDLLLVGWDEFGHPEVRVAFGDGGQPPQFSSQVIYASTRLGFPEIDADAADLDGDGDTDVVVSLTVPEGPGFGRLSLTLYALENDGQSPPGFSETVIRQSLPAHRSNIYEFELVDATGDGIPDIVGAQAGEEPNVSLYTNVLSAPLAFPQSEVYADLYPPIAVADLDGDGLRDIACRDERNRLRWMRNLGDAQFELVRPVLSQEVPLEVALSDIDRDGDTDVIAVHKRPGQLTEEIDVVVLYMNDGLTPPTFSVRASQQSGETLSGLIVADLDADARPDIVTSAASAPLILRGIPPTIDAKPESCVYAGGSLRTGGILTLDDARLVVDDVLLNESPGIIQGTGSIYSDVLNDARIAIGSETRIGALVIGGSFETTCVVATAVQQSNASTLITTGSATLAGTLTTTASDDFDPAIGQTFEILTAGDGVTGRFDVAFLPALPDRFLSVVYPEPGARNASVLLQVNELSGDVEFDPAPSTGAPAGTPTDAALADINLDGFVDLVMTVPDDVSPNQAPGSVLIFYNDGNAGDGSWNGFANVSVVQQIFTDIGIQPDGIAIGDMNSDDIPDLVIANRGIPGNIAPDSITVLINEPGVSGTVSGVTNPFGVDQSYVLPVGNEPRDVALVDLDGDTLLDIIVANAGSDTVTVLWNAGSSTRARTWEGVDEADTDELDLPPDACPFTIRPGEFDTDLFHLAVGNTGDDSVTIVRNLGARDFEVLPPIAVDGEPVELAVTDIDLDGFPEIVTVNRTGNSVSIIVNTAATSGGGIAFAPSVNLDVDASPSFPRSIAAGDFDADLDPDIAIVAKGDEQAGQPKRIVKILRNDTTDGQIIFAPAADQLAGQDPLLVRSDDINNDGRDDLVTVNESLPTSRGVRTGDGQVAVLLATRVPEACAGDIDGDGNVSLSDFATLSRNFCATELPHGGGESRGLGDLDDDGDVDMEDFKTLSADFGCQAPLR